jgi:LCP family protein required for cell wall assembly
MSGPPPPAEPPPRYTKYRARPSIFGRRRERGPDGLKPSPARPDGPPRPPGRRRPITPGRVAKWVALAVVGWIALSAVLFLVSAQIQQGKVSDAAERELSGGSFPLTAKNTILMLGSDQRSKQTAEPGSTTSGPSRSDSIMLLRVGGGANARLSIPRDTVVEIPGAGRDKINAAFARGGTSLAIQTVEDFLDIEVNHVMEVSFDNFPKLIDAMGGIDFKDGCVVAKVNGGYKNGGVTIRIRRNQEKHLDGKQALALARVRRNLCNPNENDLARARRQQKIISAMKSRMFSPSTFLRLPLVSWSAPQALKTDMSGPTLMGLFGAMSTSGNAPTRVLRPSGTTTLPDGGSGLEVDPSERRREVRRFLKG